MYQTTGTKLYLFRLNPNNKTADLLTLMKNLLLINPVETESSPA